jgi:hypothetical protein
MRENTVEFSANLIERSSCVRCVATILGIAIWLTVPACDTGRRHASEIGAAQPVLSASPNPVPAGDLDQPVGATVVTWNTGPGVSGNLYVKSNRSREVLVGSGSSGSMKIDWIQFDSTYEFRLYNEKHSRILAKLDVTREN